jgi:hypothetical protein
MPNESGVNQFAGFPETGPYGDKARQGMLQRLAPLAGKPVPEPRRASQDRARTSAQPEPAQAPPVPVPAQATLPPDQLYSTIAAIPGASDEVRSIFGGSPVAQ